MPKVIPVPDELSQPFWDAVNERRLVIQNCTICNKLQYPPQAVCQICGSADGLEWKEVAGKGHVATYIVIEDGRPQPPDARPNPTIWPWLPWTQTPPSTSTPTCPAPPPTWYP